MTPATRSHRPVPAFVLGVALAASTPALAMAAGDPSRLSRDVLPTFEAIHLDLDPAKQTYSGRVAIDIEVKAATDSFRLHARDMTLGKVSLTRGESVVPVTTRGGELGLLTVRAAKPLARGAHRLTIEFTNDLDTRANHIYRVETAGQSYVFTDFEPDDARRAFPCFDEPW